MYQSGKASNIIKEKNILEIYWAVVNYVGQITKTSMADYYIYYFGEESKGIGIVLQLL